MASSASLSLDPSSISSSEFWAEPQPPERVDQTRELSPGNRFSNANLFRVIFVMV